MGINTLTGSLVTQVKWQAANNLQGGGYNPISNNGTLQKTISLGTAASNGQSGGADEIFSFQQAIAPGGSATIDLTALTNILQQAAINIVRIKGYQIRLLSATDDTTVVTPVATSITVTNVGPTVPNALDFQNGGSGLTLTLTTAAGAISGVAIGTAGSGYPPSTTFVVVPNQTGGSGGVVAVTTNGSGVPTSTTLLAGGSGYSNATVPTTVGGSYQLNSGGAHLHADVLATGFLAVSNLSKNIKIINNDATHTATVELDVFAGTT